MRWFGSLPLLLSIACGSGATEDYTDGWAELGQSGAEVAGACARPTLLEQPRERYAADTCWRVQVPPGSGFGLTEADSSGDCESAPACLVTRAPAVHRQLLDWTAEGEDNPETWSEVRCDAGCS